MKQSKFLKKRNHSSHGFPIHLGSHVHVRQRPALLHPGAGAHQLRIPAAPALEALSRIYSKVNQNAEKKNKRDGSESKCCSRQESQGAVQQGLPAPQHFREGFKFKTILQKKFLDQNKCLFQYFKFVTRDAKLTTYRAGPTQPSFAIEKVTRAGKGLHILLSGKLAVK
jgi:hypothetical protein